MPGFCPADNARPRPARKSALFLLTAFLCVPGLRSQTDEAFAPKARADFRFELAIDAFERRVYRPEFHFAWPFGAEAKGRIAADLSYLQRTNGRLQGPIDFWIRVGYGQAVTDSVSIEASLNHFCRHVTSIDNPYVLNLNEVAGIVHIRKGSVEAGVGYGRYAGGSPGYRELLIFSLKAPHILVPELSFESEFKWVNFGSLFHEAGLSLAVGRGVDLFIRTARYYGLPSETFIGLRLSEGNGAPKSLESFRLGAGVYPFFNSHKLLVDGGFRLEIAKNENGRFLADLDFDAPILTGNGFFAQFWPDRMIYRARAQYEKPLSGGWSAAWYARYDVDMPADKAVGFLASLSTGLAVRNQPDFERLDRPFRIEAAAGIDFKYDYDLGLKLGVNTAKPGSANAGAEFRWQANSLREAAEFKIFADFGRDIAVRPFAGLKKISYAAGGTPGPSRFAERIIVGVGLYKWF
jgi:hypothetical protein